MTTAQELIKQHAEEGARLRLEYFAARADHIDTAAKHMAVAIGRGGKLLLAGNGGSAADAQHWAGEFVNRFIIDRPPLPAMALSTDTSVLTAIGNDFGYEQVFSKQVEAFGKPGDVLLVMSTSGNSPNILEAAKVARRKNMVIIALTGAGGGQLGSLCDLLLDVPHSHTPIIQEIHATIGHLLCALTDHYLFENVMAIKAQLEA